MSIQATTAMLFRLSIDRRLRLTGGLAAVAVLLMANPESAGAASGAVPICPAQLNDRQSAEDAPAGWSALQTSQRHTLTGIGFFDGRVEDQVERAPAATRTQGVVRTTTWRFEQAARPVMLVCRYAGTSLVYSAALPDAIKSCTLTTNPRMSLISHDNLRCR